MIMRFLNWLLMPFGYRLNLVYANQIAGYRLSSVRLEGHQDARQRSPAPIDARRV